MANILVVDDELGIRDLLSEILNDEGHSVDLAENATQARSARAANSYDLVLLDIWMPDTDGVSLLKEWSTAGALTMPVIMMSGHATIDTAVEATRIGAFSFLEKPITLQKLLKAVEQGLARTAVQQAPVVAHQPTAAGPVDGGFLPAPSASTTSGGTSMPVLLPICTIVVWNFIVRRSSNEVCQTPSLRLSAALSPTRPSGSPFG